VHNFFIYLSRRYCQIENNLPAKHIFLVMLLMSTKMTQEKSGKERKNVITCYRFIVLISASQAL